jgi:hypothetical protein
LPRIGRGGPPVRRPDIPRFAALPVLRSICLGL